MRLPTFHLRNIRRCFHSNIVRLYIYLGVCICIYNLGRQSSAFLSVRSAPQITLANKDDLVHDAGLRVRIRCTATGFPYPYVSWYKEGQPLLFDDRIRMVSVLMIQQDLNHPFACYPGFYCWSRVSGQSVPFIGALVLRLSNEFLTFVMSIIA